jgi:hypothetical protein
MRRSRYRTIGRRAAARAGLASLDYVLILGVVLPMIVFIMWIGPRIIRLAYEMVCVLVSWPFM